MRTEMSCWIVMTVAALLSFSAFPGCYQLVYKPGDEKNLRLQFHLPSDVRMIHMDSNPKSSSGWFGREGLRIHGVFQFDDRQFEEYVRMLTDRTKWSPVPFLHYSPGEAESFSNDCFTWKDLPVPERQNYLAGIYEDLKIESGKYYCSVITYQRGRKIEHAGGGHYYEWNTRGLHCSEMPAGTSAVIATFGVLDYGGRKLFAYIGFSG